MRSIISNVVLFGSLAILSACGSGDGSEDRQTAETRMDDLDSLEGTISDDAINTDQSTEEGPIEAAPATTAPAKGERPKASEETGGPAIVEIPATEDKADTE